MVSLITYVRLEALLRQAIGVSLGDGKWSMALKPRPWPIQQWPIFPDKPAVPLFKDPFLP